MGWLADRRRNKLLQTPFPADWRDILDTNVAIYGLLPAQHQARLRELTQIFVAESHWEGCGGLVVDDEIKVTIAASAAQMALGKGPDLFADVGSIFVYPSAVVTKRADVAVYTSPTPVADGFAIDGQAHPKGPVVLAWDAALDGALDPSDGRNVVVHEIAHKIDFLDGLANGTPVLPNKRARQAWRAAFEPAFAAHRERAAWGLPSLIRDYATIDPAEYFACACETFFEQPDQMRAELPEVHAQLAAFFAANRPDL